MTLKQDHTAETDDARLMACIAKGDEKAYATLVQKHLGRTVRMAIRIVGNQADAEDVAQDAFIRVWKHAENWNPDEKGGAKFTTWFYRVVTNLCIDYTRKKKGIALDNIAEQQTEDDDGLQNLEKQDAYSILKDHVDALPERQRIALTLCFYEEMSNKDAAQVMEISVKALESLLVRARRTLKEKMKPQRDMIRNG